MKWLVVGISGTTCSGKTTIATKLSESIKDSVLIQQDKYFLSPDDSRHTLVSELNHFNWEIMSSLDMPKMYTDVTNLIGCTNKNTESNQTPDKSIRLLILEGFILYNYKPIADLCNQKYFIEISREVCWDRRNNRVYDPPDVPGYFDKVVWPEYIRHRNEMESDDNLHKSIKFINGTRDLNDICNDLISEVKTLLV